MLLKFFTHSCVFFLQKEKNKMDIEQILKEELERANLINKLKKISKKPEIKTRKQNYTRKRIALINLFARKSLKKNLKNVYGF